MKYNIPNSAWFKPHATSIIPADDIVNIAIILFMLVSNNAIADNNTADIKPDTVAKINKPGYGKNK